MDLIAILGMVAAPVTNSGLIVLLPLVGAVVGGIVGAWANSWYRNREVKKAEDRERKGLLTLIDQEMLGNNENLKWYVENEAHLLELLSLFALRTENWDISRARLTQLLPPYLMQVLAEYYTNIFMIQQMQQVVESIDTRHRPITATDISKFAVETRSVGEDARWTMYQQYFKGSDYIAPEPERFADLDEN